MSISVSHVRPGPKRIALTPQMRREIEAYAKGCDAIQADNPSLFGQAGENAVLHWLTAHGYEAKKLPRGQGADLLLGGKLRLEVKCSSPNDHGKWTFNLHHHGVLDESRVDLYIFRIEKLPEFSHALHLIVPAPLNRLTVSMSLRSLILRWGQFANRFDLLGEPTQIDLEERKELAGERHLA